jgi:hypothetical protein
MLGDFHLNKKTGFVLIANIESRYFNVEKWAFFEQEFLDYTNNVSDIQM